MWKLQLQHSCNVLLLLLCLLFLILAAASAGDHQGNSAKELVNIMNENRTAHKLPKLFDNPGLGCMALQYISGCMKNCSSNNTVSCHLSEDDITEVFAPNCGVELPTIDTISGHIIGCRWEHLKPEEAFSKVLFQSNKTVSMLHNKTHTEVGLGLIGEHHGPFFWCILLSSGQSNSTFVLEGGTGIKQQKGCFSGTDTPCNAGQVLYFGGVFPTLMFTILGFIFTLT